jgi:hypothetical protein
VEEWLLSREHANQNFDDFMDPAAASAQPGMKVQIGVRQTSMMARLIRKAATPWLMITLVLIGTAAGAESRPGKVPAAKVEIVGQISHKLVRNVPIEDLVWCHDKKPAFVFVDRTKVARATFAGDLEDIIQATQILDPSSLRCSEKNGVITVFTYDRTVLIIIVGSRIGRYKALTSGSHGFRLRGDYLSPDGSSIVVPFNLSFLDGDDVLRSMRVIQVPGEDYAWNNDAVIYFDPNDKTVYSYNPADGSSQKILVLGQRYVGRKYELAGIARCNSRVLASILFREPKKSAPNAVLISLSPPSNQPVYESSTSSLALSGSGGACVITESRQADDDELNSYKMEAESGTFGVLAVPFLVHLPYSVAISSNDCLMLGLQYPPSSIPGDSSQVKVAALRVSSPSYCRPRQRTQRDTRPSSNGDAD